MGSRYGKTTPILLTGIVIAALCLVGIVLMQRGEMERPADAGGVSEAPSSGGLTGPGAPGVEPSEPDTFTDADAQRLEAARTRLKEVINEHQRVERELQGARYAALKSNPELKAQLDQSQALKREVGVMIAALPEYKEIEQRRDQHMAHMQAAQERTKELERKVTDGRKAHEKALAEGQSVPVEDSTMRQMLTELKQLKKDSADLKRDLLSCIKDVRKLELESKENHPTISRKVVEAERIRREVSDALAKSGGVAALFNQRDRLIEERKALVTECAELGSLSNRVAAAQQEEKS